MVDIYQPPALGDAHFNAIFFGVLGSGKTHLLGTAQECERTYPMLLIDFNGGTLTLAGKKIDITSPRSFAEAQEVYDFLRFENREYRSVGVDTLTDEQQDLSLSTLLDETDEDGGFTDLGSDNRPTQFTWVTSAHQMRKFVRAFRGLSYLKDPNRRLHVFITAHEKVDTDRSGHGVPDVSGAVGEQVCRYVDVVGHLVNRRVKTKSGEVVSQRFLHTEEHYDKNEVLWLGKNRTGRLGKGVVDPTIAKLIDLWQEGVEERPRRRRTR